MLWPTANMQMTFRHREKKFHQSADCVAQFDAQVWLNFRRWNPTASTIFRSINHKHVESANFWLANRLRFQFRSTLNSSNYLFIVCLASLTLFICYAASSFVYCARFHFIPRYCMTPTRRSVLRLLNYQQCEMEEWTKEKIQATNIDFGWRSREETDGRCKTRHGIALVSSFCGDHSVNFLCFVLGNSFAVHALSFIKPSTQDHCERITRRCPIGNI